MTHVLLSVLTLMVQAERAVEPAQGTAGAWSLVIMFDVSASMRLGPDEADAIVAAVDNGLAAQLEPKERVRVGAFASEIRLAPGLRRPEYLTEDLRQSFTGEPQWRYGPSRLWDAVEAASLLLEAEDGQRVVVVVSDGTATGNELGRAQVAAILRARRVALWSISIVRGFGDDQLRALVIDTGGRVFHSRLGGEGDVAVLVEVLGEILGLLRRGPRIPKT